ncbi:MAG: DUF1570 domain-containing protein [Tepidisphaeraceae bacterium]
MSLIRVHPRSSAAILLFLFCGLVLLLTNDIASAGALRTLRSAHYNVHTDIEQSLAEEMGRRLDAMYDEYARRLDQFRISNPDQKFEVYLFAKRDDYMRLTQNRFPNTAGIFMPGRNLLAAFLEGQGRDGLRRTLQHEAFHQFVFTAISPDMPIWLNEGMAQYFEEGVWTGNSFMIGQVSPRRVRQLQHDMTNKQIVPFRTMLTMTDEQWATNLTGSAERGATQYNQVWAMVHFLVHGANGSDKYRPRLINMLKLIHEGKPSTDAFVEAFSRNVDGFQARFEEWAGKLAATPEATMIERQDVLADLLAESSRRGQTYGDVRSFREEVIASNARIRYTKGQIKWETSPDARVYFSDLENRVFDNSELYFENRNTAPLPDIVLRAGKLRLRTRFYSTEGRTEHEVLCEPPSR